MTTGPYDQDPENVRGAGSTPDSGATPPDPPSSGDSPYGNSPYGTPEHGNPQHGNPEYGGSPYGNAPYGDPSYGASSGYGEPYPTAGYQSYPAAGGANQMNGGAGQPGGLGIRFGARIIDHLIVGIPYAIIVAIIAAAISGSGGAVTWVVNLIVSALFAVAWIGYFVWFETNKGQTLGKMVLKLRVLGPAGGNPTTQESVKRNGYVALEAIGIFLGALIPFVGFILQILCGIGALVLIIVIAVSISDSRTKQGKHDQMAGGTQVVTTQ